MSSFFGRILNTGTVVIADNGAVTGFVYTNNFSKHNAYGMFGSGAGLGATALATYFPGYVFSKNVLAGGTAASYPGGNYFPSVTMLVSKSKGVPEAQDSRRDVAEHLVQPRRGAPVGEADARGLTDHQLGPTAAARGPGVWPRM